MSGLKISRGEVMHARHGDKMNSFSYPVFTLVFPLAEEELVQAELKKRYKGFLSLKGKDYLKGEESSLESALRNFLSSSCQYQAEEVILQTYPRMFGYVFNPISFWFCYKNGTLDAVLCEVNNTFGERHFYWIHDPAELQASTWIRREKVFHVSPFYPVEGYYQFRFQLDRIRTRVDIRYYNSRDELQLTTWVQGVFSSPAENPLTALVLKYGWMTIFVILRIHWQALRLWVKGVKFFSKPPPPGQEIS